MECTQIRNLRLFNGDNMEYMKDIPDSYYDLAIVISKFFIIFTL